MIRYTLFYDNPHVILPVFDLVKSNLPKDATYSAVRVPTNHRKEWLEVNVSLFDKPCDLHITGISYLHNPIRFKNCANQTFVYQNDNSPCIQLGFLETDKVVTVIDRAATPKKAQMMLAPYGVREYFVKQADESKQSEEYDLVWCGTAYEKYIDGSRFKKMNLIRDWCKNNKIALLEVEAKYSIPEYCRILSSGRTVLNLRGCAENCFRFYEAMYLGLSVLSEMMTDEPFWGNPPQTMFVLNEESFLKAYNNCTNLSDWYEKQYSPQNLKKWAIEAVKFLGV